MIHVKGVSIRKGTLSTREVDLDEKCERKRVIKCACHFMSSQQVLYVLNHQICSVLAACVCDRPLVFSAREKVHHMAGTQCVFYLRFFLLPTVYITPSKREIKTKQSGFNRWLRSTAGWQYILILCSFKTCPVTTEKTHSNRNSTTNAIKYPHNMHYTVQVRDEYIINSNIASAQFCNRIMLGELPFNCNGQSQAPVPG